MVLSDRLSERRSERTNRLPSSSLATLSFAAGASREHRRLSPLRSVATCLLLSNPLTHFQFFGHEAGKASFNRRGVVHHGVAAGARERRRLVARSDSASMASSDDSVEDGFLDKLGKAAGKAFQEYEAQLQVLENVDRKLEAAINMQEIKEEMEENPDSWFSVMAKNGTRRGQGRRSTKKILNRMFGGMGGSGGTGPFLQFQLGGPDDDDDDDEMGNDGRKEGAPSLDSIKNFDLKPKEVVEYLDRFVIQQSDAKKVLAVAICDHYNHCRSDLIDAEDARLVDYAKPNILLAGPTGVGKTYLMKTIARLIGVPFVKGDATKFSETGVFGRDVEDLVRDLVDAAGGNATLASYGIIYIDEVDKIASGGSLGEGRSLQRGVQNNFLKLLEETDVSLSNDKIPMPMMMGGPQGSINTRNILFIFSGAFTGLDEQIKRKKEQKTIGFSIDDPSPAGDGAESTSTPVKKSKSFLRFAETADFISAGLEAEFVGRLPVRVALNSLDAEDLREILTSAEGSVLGQFINDFEGYNINMTADDAALTQLAVLAEKENTGARGLVTVLEKTLREHKYELPSSSVRSFVLDNASVNAPAEGLAKLLEGQEPEDELATRLHDLKRWERQFESQVEPIQTWMSDEARDYMLDLAMENKGSTYWFATRYFEKLPAIFKKVADDCTNVTDRLPADAYKITMNVTIELVKELQHNGSNLQLDAESWELQVRKLVKSQMEVGEPPEKPKKAQETSDEKVYMQVQDPNGKEVNFRIKRTTPLGKFMDTYCSRFEYDASEVRFTIAGKELAPDDTIEKLGLEDEKDGMKVVVEKIGDES